MISDDATQSPGLHVLAIIPARGGSKNVPRKNIRPLDGTPLIGHVYRAADQATPPITETILSTDDEEIADVGRGLGIQVPFLRPAALARDDSTAVALIRHAIEAMEDSRGVQFDPVVLLQPTSPFTRAGHIRDAVALIVDGGYDSVCSVTEAGNAHPAYMVTRTGDGFDPLMADGFYKARRQQLDDVYLRCGNVYAFRRFLPMADGVVLGGRQGCIEIAAEDAVNINTPLDWTIAEAIVGKAKQGRGRS